VKLEETVETVELVTEIDDDPDLMSVLVLVDVLPGKLTTEVVVWPETIVIQREKKQRNVNNLAHLKRQ
jgi:hypothetical protein